MNDVGLDSVLLSDARATDANLTGGKGASLALLRGSFDVPEAFVLTADLAVVDDATARLERLRRAVAEGWRSLVGGGARAVAVRSSAVAEDGARTSFAGQLETILNVRDEEAIVAAVTTVWRSAQSARARAYGVARGAVGEAAIDPSRVAVVVQQIVFPDVAGVAFSRDPVRGTDNVVVDLNYGLGESVVGGIASPDTFRVSRDGRIVETHIGSKQRMVVPIDGGTREAGVPRLLRSVPCASPETVARIANLALRAERHTSAAVDIEVAVEGERLYLLQCRPITTEPATLATKESTS